MHPDLLRCLRCPITKSPLQLAEEELVGRINRAIAAGNVSSRMSQRLERPLDGGLVNAQRTYLLPIYGGIPCLIGDNAIPLDQLSEEPAE